MYSYAISFPPPPSFLFSAFQGELPPLAENEEILSFIATTGVDQLALDGGFVAPDVGSVIPTSSVDSADPPAAVKPPAVGVVASIA